MDDKMGYPTRPVKSDGLTDKLLADYPSFYGSGRECVRRQSGFERAESNHTGNADADALYLAVELRHPTFFRIEAAGGGELCGQRIAPAVRTV
jgi:hypothetical protein